tara:strand:+ start:56621 stop:59038 length:2418 start_codon:yes stop_codon:yes gene_type:complete
MVYGIRVLVHTSDNMLKNYIKIALRNLWKSRFYTSLNIFGLAVGMAAFILIAMWVLDELNYNKYHSHYEQIAQIRQNRISNGEVQTQLGLPGPLATHLKTSFPNYFEEVVLSSHPARRVLTYQQQTVFRNGYFMESGGEKILDLKIIRGAPAFPLDASSFLISESLSKSLFGEQDPIGKLITIDNSISVEITGVYQDLPPNSTFGWTFFFGSLDLYVKFQRWAIHTRENWNNSFWQTYALLKSQVSSEEVSTLIRDEVFNITEEPSHPELFLYPMSKWHLYPDFKNGKWVSTRLNTLWRFGLIGILILILAVINFINLSTARAGKRAREIGIRKSIGSLKRQLVTQFLTESFLVVVIALGLSVVIVQLALPFFNQIAVKSMELNLLSGQLWLLLFIFAFITSLLAGSYPAFYLAAINPVRVLKNIPIDGRGTILPRKVLVVLQFSISITLIILTLVVYQQIQLGKERSLGYKDNNLIHIWKRSANIRGPRQSETIVQELLQSGIFKSVAESSGPVTERWDNYSLDWNGKNPDLIAEFAGLDISPEFGETIQWNLIVGRNFSRDYSLDSSAMILNEAAIKVMGFDNPLNKVIRWREKDFRVIGVVQNLLIESPFDRIRPMVFTMGNEYPHYITIRLKNHVKIPLAISTINGVFEKVNGGVPDIQFVDQELETKYHQEERTGRLSTVFSGLAIFISLLGLFGLASFVAEQKTKEIGVRKVMGANAISITRNISLEFITLVGISFLLAFPSSYFLSQHWLDQYSIQATISPLEYVLVGSLVLVVTILTVGYQALRAAMANPAKVLRSE